MRTDGYWFYHCAIIERHSIRKHYYAVFICNEIILSDSVCLESLHTKLLADIVLSSSAWTAFAAHKLRTTCHIISWLAYLDILSYRYNFCGIFMSLDNRIECCRMFSMIRVYFTAAYTDSADFYKDLVRSKIFCCRCRYIAQFDIVLI